MNDNNNEKEYPKVCCMCHRSESKTGPQQILMGNMSICSDCMNQAMNAALQYTGGDLSKLIPGNMMNPMSEEDFKNFIAQMGMAGNVNPDNGEEVFLEEDENETSDDEVETLQEVTFDEGGNPVETELIRAESEEKPENPKKPEAPSEKEEKKKPRMPRPPFGGFSMVMTPQDLQQMFSQGNKGNKKKKEKLPEINMSEVKAPHEIYQMLSEYVVGQEDAKKAISVGIYNHYKRLANKDKDVEIEKSNMLMIGPTGSGKTFLVQTLAKLLNVPLAIADATALTEAGYIGDDIESVVTKLLSAAGDDVEKAERGIIYIDEIDKLARKRNATQRDVSGESVQQGLLKLLEGAKVEVPVGANSKNAMVPLETVDTRNILFICGGAFPDLEDIIKERLNEKSSMGFGSELKDKYDKEKDILKYVETEDVRKFGMIPEFIGRLPIMFTLQPMTKEMLVRVLTEPKNAIVKQYKKLLEMDGVHLDFTDEAYNLIAEKALKKNTGARALRSIIEQYMMDIMFEIPKDPNIGEVIITKEFLEGTGGPQIKIRENIPVPQRNRISENEGM